MSSRGLIILDTSVLINSLSGLKRSAPALRSAIEAGRRIAIPALVFYEWFRGPRQASEIAAQEALFPSEKSLPFGAAEAHLSAQLYRTVKCPRGREIDLAIAASALTRDAELWTLNEADFADIPGLRLTHF